MVVRSLCVPWPELLVVVFPWCLLGGASRLAFQETAPPATCLHVPRREVLRGSSVSVPCAGVDHDREEDGSHIRWYKDGKPVMPAQQHGRVAVNGSSLRLMQLGTADSACYQCSWGNGRWSSYALEVVGPMSPPTITNADGNVVSSKLGSLVQGEPLELYCSPPEEFPSARIRWQLQDQWGPSSSAAAGTTVFSSGTGSMLRIEALERRHQGMKLRCTASRPVAGAASAVVTLDVFREHAGGAAERA
ncbi:hypothetical protein V5799_010876 [Amblyomma americanum]|uniref:Ig-like domain-containing protein n=1 Tax=Amblyomma americanum TaxID=6943 RepID=A0AAQ4EJH3_AMBAM